MCYASFFFQAEDGIRDLVRSRGLGDVYKRQIQKVWKGIEAGVFPENPSTWKCNPRYCEYWPICRGKLS